MSTTEDQLNEFQKEYRSLIVAKLDRLEAGQTAIQQTINTITSTCASQSELDALRTDIDALKSFKYKAIGIIIGLNAVFAVIAWLIQSAIFLHH
jgi:hypothetical protein